MHLIVHAGPPKTGTTALQSLLWHNQAALAAQGVRYFSPRIAERPDAPAEWALMMPYAWSGGPMPGPLCAHFPDHAAALGWSLACWDAFEQELAAEKAPLGVISSEHFANISDCAGFVARLRGQVARVTVVGYARDPVALYASTLAERIRGGTRLADLPPPERFGYRGVANLRRFAPLLGSDGLILRPWHPPGGAGPDVTADFTALLGGLAGRALHLPVAPVDTNPALPGAVTAWLMGVNEMTAAEPDAATLAARARGLARLQGAAALADLPPLRLDEPEICAILRAGATETLAWLRDHHAIGADWARPGPPPPALPLPQQARRLRAWLLSYLTPRALRLITREVVGLF